MSIFYRSDLFNNKIISQTEIFVFNLCVKFSQHIHVCLMTNMTCFPGNSWQQAKPVEIVRQSMPFGSLSSEAGLFFIGYAASPKNFEFMLDRMVGARDDSNCDDIMRLSKNIKGTYWYFPGADELKKFA